MRTERRTMIPASQPTYQIKTVCVCLPLEVRKARGGELVDIIYTTGTPKYFSKSNTNVNSNIWAVFRGLPLIKEGVGGNLPQKI